MVGLVVVDGSFEGAVPILDSMLLALVEPAASPVFSSSSFTRGGSSEICQKKL